MLPYGAALIEAAAAALLFIRLENPGCVQVRRKYSGEYLAAVNMESVDNNNDVTKHRTALAAFRNVLNLCN